MSLPSSPTAQQVKFARRGREDFTQGKLIYSDPDFQAWCSMAIFESQAAPALDAYDFLLKIESHNRGRLKAVCLGVSPPTCWNFPPGLRLLSRP